MTLVLALGLAGGVGALARFLLDGIISERVKTGFPMGTLVVNVTGAALLGLVAGVALKGDALTIVATGGLGSYTTFSTWMFESQRLGEDGSDRLLALNLVVSLIAGIAAVWLGRELGALG